MGERPVDEREDDDEVNGLPDHHRQEEPRHESESGHRVHHLQGQPGHQQHHRHWVKPTTHSTAGVAGQINQRVATGDGADGITYQRNALYMCEVTV